MNIHLKSLGYYKALAASATQFNSIIFRVVIGFLIGLPGETIALICTLEFALNLILEIPLGYCADRFGKIESAIVGHAFIILALTSGYIGIINFVQTGLSLQVFFILHGVLLGIGKPLMSGSVEAFYQSLIIENSKYIEEAENSMTISSQYGKAFTLVAVIVAFLAIFTLKLFDLTEHSFIIGILLWMTATRKLIKDYRAFKPSFAEKPQVSIRIDGFLSSITHRKRFLKYITVHGLAFLALGLIAGYYPVTLGRTNNELKWYGIIIFYVFSQGIGTYIRGYFLPTLITKIGSNRLLQCLSAMLIVSGFVLYILSRTGTETSVFLTLNILFSLTLFVSTTSILGIITNKILALSTSQFSATSVSVMSMPGYLGFAILSYIFYYFFNGTPEIETLSYILIAIALTLGMMSLKLDERKDSGK
jgi:hypothetical protein